MIFTGNNGLKFELIKNLEKNIVATQTHIITVQSQPAIGPPMAKNMLLTAFLRFNPTGIIFIDAFDFKIVFEVEFFQSGPD